MADIKIAGRIKAGAADGISGYASEILFDDQASNKTVKEVLEGKQDKLTFDNVPTEGSNKPVKSGGVYQAIQSIDVSGQISGKADKSEMSVVAGTGANADKTTITLKSGTSATVLTQHQDVSEFLREGEVFGSGDDSAASFNSYADTVWNKQQTLSESQKQQVRENIGITDLETIRNGAAAGATAIQSVTVGTTTTGAAGSSASVVNSGTATAPVLDFTIPQGAQGIKGDTVIMGNEDTYTLYNTTGDAVDGAMTQQAVTRELAELGGLLYTESNYPFELGTIDASSGQDLVRTDGTRIRTIGYVPKSTTKINLTVTRSCTHVNIILYNNGSFAGSIQGELSNLTAGTYVYEVNVEYAWDSYRIVCFTSDYTSQNLDGNYSVGYSPIKDNVLQLEESMYNALNNGYPKNYDIDFTSDASLAGRLTKLIYNNGSVYEAGGNRSVLLLAPTPSYAKKFTVASSLEYTVHFLSGIDDRVVAPYANLGFTFISESGYGTGERTVTIPAGTTRIDIQFKSANTTTILNSITKLKYVCTSTATIITDFDIVDNLSDGGTDKVLSAEQGKVLGQYTRNIDYVTGNPSATFTDITTIGRTNANILDVSLDSTNGQIKFEAKGNKTDTTYAWINLPSNLVNGQTYRMSFDSTASIGSGCDGWFAISTSNTNASTGYKEGIAVTANAHRTLTFEKTAAKQYLMVSSYSIGNTGSYAYISNIEFHAYSGETYDSLPTLTEKVDGFIGSFADASITGYYGGEKVPSLNKWMIGAKRIMANATCQAGAAYGNYFFQFTNHHSDMKVYDLSTKTLHSTVAMTSVSSDHCNNACFSNIFYDTNDEFPLIYTSGSQTGSYNHVQVWRIQFADNVFSITKVQEITLPTGDTGNIWYWGQAYLDNERGYMWYSTSANGNAHFMKFAIPAVFDGDSNVVSEVTLTDADIIDSFTTISNANQQGGVVKNGILYLLDGVPSWGTYTKLYVYNLWSKSLINTIDIYHILGITSEFEGCGIWNDTLIANTNGGGIYAIYL